MKSIGFGRSTGKIILMGEHSAVYGEPSIVMPFTLVKCTVEVKTNKRDVNWIECIHFKGSIADLPSQFSNIYYLIYSLINKFSLIDSIDLVIQSEIPIERGMGSSAGVATAITRAFYDYVNAPLYQETLLYFVNQSEKIVHEKPSGMDAFATSSNKLICFEDKKFSTYLSLKMDSILIVAESGIKGNTHTAIKKVESLIKNDRQSTEKKIKKLGSLAGHAKKSLMERDSITLGLYFNKAHSILKDLRVSIPFIDNLIDTAINLGALGAKMTGGGLGGTIIVLSRSIEHAELIKKGLRKQGVKQMWTQPLNLE